MSLRPDVSITAGLATVGIVYGTYQILLPRATDVRAAPDGDAHVDKAERTATWVAASLVAGVSLIARDANIFILGGTATVVMAWTYRHANTVNPLTAVANSFTNSRAVPAPAAVPDDGGAAMYASAEGF